MFRFISGRNSESAPFRRKAFAVMLMAGLFLLLSSCSAGNHALRKGSSDSVRNGWPQDDSDLPVDPSIHFGHLDNGLRFILKENRSPADRVGMHLYVQAGSLQETQEEQGIAHFLEHMLFNGSRHFPPGELVKFFQRIGMQFGPDANAHTGFLQTVYDIVLPAGDEKSLSEGLLVLRDYADGALLSEEETERERKVILAEMRDRDSSRFRTLKKAFGFEMPGLLVSRRFPIGEEGTIKAIDHRMLKTFYETWYRPERMILIVVGDMDPDITSKLIEQQFGDLKARAPVRPEPDFGRMDHKGVNAFFHFEEEAGSTRVSIETIVQEKQPADAVAYYKQTLLEDLANDMVQKRLDAAIKRARVDLTSADITSGHFLGELRYSEISAQCKPDQWKTAIVELERSLRRAIQFGFTSQELLRSKNDYRAQLLQAVRESNTRDSKQLTAEIISSLNDWRVLLSPKQQWEVLGPMLDTIQPDEVNRAFAGIWAADHRLVLVTGNALLKDASPVAEAQILSAYQQSSIAAVQPLSEMQTSVFPFLPAPVSSGSIAQRRSLPDLGIEQVQFANGFHLNLKKTDFKKNQVLVALSFGRGLASEPKQKPGLAELTEAVVNESGFSRMDYTELQETLSGRIADVRLTVREDMFILQGEAASQEIQLLFELLYARIRDQGYRETVRNLALKRFEQKVLAMQRRPDGLLQLRGESFLAGGDHRFGFPSLDQLEACSLDDIRRWYGTQLDQAPMEMAVVGDIDPDGIISMAARYFGSLPQRESQSLQTVQGPTFPKGRSLKLEVDSQIPKALVVVAYATDDFWDIQKTRRLAVMAELFSERLRTRVREKLGAAYSPYAYNRSYRAFDHFGFIRIVIQVDPGQTAMIEKEVRNIAAEMAAGGPDQDEFKRVLDPNLTYIKDLRQENSYWLNSVLTGVSRYPQQLDWSRTFEQDYAAVTAEEVASLSRLYLDNQNVATVIITPR
jgi:zinc protease